MNCLIFLTTAFLTQALTGCPITNCYAYTSAGICYRNRTDVNNVWNIDTYGNNINSRFHYCPIATTYCDEFQIVYPNSTALCLPLKVNGALCFSSYQCQSGLCVLGVCASIQGSDNIKCRINPDCEFGLSCISGICKKPKTVGQSCNSITYFGGIGMDINDCDYTKKLLCGYTGSSTSTYTCLALFSVTTNAYVTNPLLCSTMITDQGWSQGYCIANRAIELPILSYDSGKTYKTCNTDSDCNYNLNGTQIIAPSGSCMCAIGDAHAQSYCKYGGGEPQIISDVAFYIKYWIAQYGLEDNPSAWKYVYSLDRVLRNTFINPAYCAGTMFMRNITIVPSSLPSTLLFYIGVLAVFAIGVGGIIVTFMMC